MQAEAKNADSRDVVNLKSGLVKVLVEVHPRPAVTALAGLTLLAVGFFVGAVVAKLKADADADAAADAAL